MARDRDVDAFDRRASGYESGRLGGLHRDIADRTIRIALAEAPDPRRVLDVGCGTGYLLRQMAARLPGAVDLAGVDAAPGMIEVARSAEPADPRLRFSEGFAEALPHPAGSFDLVVSTTSFDHWADQGAGSPSVPGCSPRVGTSCSPTSSRSGWSPPWSPAAAVVLGRWAGPHAC